MKPNDMMSCPEWEEVKMYVIDDIIKNHPGTDPDKINFRSEGDKIGIFYGDVKKGELEYKIVEKKKAPIFDDINPN